MSKPGTHQRPEGTPYKHGCCVLSAGCWPDPPQESEPTTKDWTPPSVGKSCHMGSLHPGPHAPAHGHLWTFPNSASVGTWAKQASLSPSRLASVHTVPRRVVPPISQEEGKIHAACRFGQMETGLKPGGSPRVSKPQLPLGNPRSSCSSRLGPPGPSARGGLRTLVRRARQGGRVGSLRVWGLPRTPLARHDLSRQPQGVSRSSKPTTCAHTHPRVRAHTHTSMQVCHTTPSRVNQAQAHAHSTPAPPHADRHVHNVLSRCHLRRSPQQEAVRTRPSLLGP